MAEPRNWRKLLEEYLEIVRQMPTEEEVLVLVNVELFTEALQTKDNELLSQWVKEVRDE